MLIPFRKMSVGARRSLAGALMALAVVLAMASCSRQNQNIGDDGGVPATANEGGVAQVDGGDSGSPFNFMPPTDDASSFDAGGWVLSDSGVWTFPGDAGGWVNTDSGWAFEGDAGSWKESSDGGWTFTGDGGGWSQESDGGWTFVGDAGGWKEESDGGWVYTGDGGTCLGGAAECNVACSDGGTTTVSGTVYAPNGTLPIYNVLVYVPNGPLDPITDGITCSQCEAPTSGDPLVTAYSDPTGHFELKNVPVGSNIPLVVQLGKWRRETTLPQVNPCVQQRADESGPHAPPEESDGREHAAHRAHDR